MTISTVRHNKTLEWNNKLVIALRLFVVDDKIRYVHICGFNCEYVLLYDHLVYRKSYLNNYKTIVQVAKANYLSYILILKAYILIILIGLITMKRKL